MSPSNFIKFTAKVAKNSTMEYFRPIVAVSRWINESVYPTLVKIYNNELVFTQDENTYMNKNKVRRFETKFIITAGLPPKNLEHIIERFFNVLSKYNAQIIDSNKVSAKLSRAPYTTNGGYEQVTLQFLAVNVSEGLIQSLKFNDQNVLSLETRELKQDRKY